MRLSTALICIPSLFQVSHDQSPTSTSTAPEKGEGVTEASGDSRGQPEESLSRLPSLLCPFCPHRNTFDGIRQLRAHLASTSHFPIIPDAD